VPDDDPPSRIVSLVIVILGVINALLALTSLTAQAVLRALVSRRIEWRGRVYEMCSPSETVIVH